MKPSGYSLLLSPERKDILLECIESEKSFAEPVPEFIYSRGMPLFCIIGSADEGITHLGIGRRGIRAGTNMSRLNIDSFMALKNPIQPSDLISVIPGRFKSAASDRLLKGGLFTPKALDNIIEALNQLSPESRGFIERFGRSRAERIGRLSEQTQVSLAYQKQAVMTALAVAGMDRDELLFWSPPSDGAPTSFLDGLPNARLREDPMVINDMLKVPGFDLVRTLPYGAAIFESETERLTIVLANRLPLEEQTGTDLIYYNETFRSFVMVQYKAMEKDNEEKENIFRLPNKQLENEIIRMDGLLEAFRALDRDENCDSFRLNENPFFLKLCPRVVFEPDTVDLVTGMYLPLDYWKMLAIHPRLAGPKGGLRVTYDNVGRYLNNTEFIYLVAKGWVGTSINQSNALTPIVREVVETGTAVAIAVKTNTFQQNGDVAQF
jgi:hypothetical protein